MSTSNLSEPKLTPSPQWDASKGPEHIPPLAVFDHPSWRDCSELSKSKGQLKNKAQLSWHTAFRLLTAAEGQEQTCQTQVGFLTANKSQQTLVSVQKGEMQHQQTENSSVGKGDANQK